MKEYNNDVGKTILSRDGKEAGIITKITYRYCAGCQRFGPTYLAKWEDGHRTYPCPAACKTNPDGRIQIE